MEAKPSQAQLHLSSSFIKKPNPEGSTSSRTHHSQFHALKPYTTRWKDISDPLLDFLLANKNQQQVIIQPEIRQSIFQVLTFVQQFFHQKNKLLEKHPLDVLSFLRQLECRHNQDQPVSHMQSIHQEVKQGSESLEEIAWGSRDKSQQFENIVMGEDGKPISKITPKKAHIHEQELSSEVDILVLQKEMNLSNNENCEAISYLNCSDNSNLIIYNEEQDEGCKTNESAKQTFDVSRTKMTGQALQQNQLESIYDSSLSGLQNSSSMSFERKHRQVLEEVNEMDEIKGNQ